MILFLGAEILALAKMLKMEIQVVDIRYIDKSRIYE